MQWNSRESRLLAPFKRFKHVKAIEPTHGPRAAIAGQRFLLLLCAPYLSFRCGYQRLLKWNSRTLDRNASSDQAPTILLTRCFGEDVAAERKRGAIRPDCASTSSYVRRLGDINFRRPALEVRFAMAMNCSRFVEAMTPLNRSRHRHYRVYIRFKSIELGVSVQRIPELHISH